MLNFTRIKKCNKKHLQRI